MPSRSISAAMPFSFAVQSLPLRVTRRTWPRVDAGEHAVAVELDLVRPVAARRRFGDQRRELGRERVGQRGLDGTGRQRRRGDRRLLRGGARRRSSLRRAGAAAGRARHDAARSPPCCGVAAVAFLAERALPPSWSQRAVPPSMPRPPRAATARCPATRRRCCSRPPGRASSSRSLISSHGSWRSLRARACAPASSRRAASRRRAGTSACRRDSRRRGSPSGCQVPRSQTITSPAPYWFAGIVPSKLP